MKIEVVDSNHHYIPPNEIQKLTPYQLLHLGSIWFSRPLPSYNENDADDDHHHKNNTDHPKNYTASYDLSLLS